MKIVLLSLQLATQYFVVLQVAKRGVTREMQFAMQRLLRHKLQEKLPRVTWHWPFSH